MAVDYDATTDQIISLVGGTDNINNVTHCVTRLRFTLKDIDLADAHADAIAKLPGVIKVLKAGGQFQVVIGNQVEAIEFNIKESIPHLTGIPLKDVRIKKNILICAIIRKRQVIIPNGSDTIELDDSVIIVTKDQRFSELRGILE